MASLFMERKNFQTLVVDVTSVALLLLVMAVTSTTEGVYHRIETSDTKTEIIQSEGFPGTYPADVNITWYWYRDDGHWAVVFFTFVLDRDIYSVRDEDWLEIDDGEKRLRYTNSTPPPTDLITPGPQLTIRFQTDKKVDPRSLGFHLKVLYAKNSNELPIKIHEAKQAENRNKEDEFPLLQKPLVILISTLLAVVIIGIVVVVYFVYRRHHRSDSFSRSSGIPADSGVFHTRNRSFLSQEGQQRPQPNFTRQNSNQQQLQQQQQQIQQQPQRQNSSDNSRDRSMETTGTGHRPSVQRSNSNAQQMNWILRAELSTALQTADRKSKPNLYIDMPPVCGASTTVEELPRVHTHGNSKGHDTDIKGLHCATNDVTVQAKNLYADENNPRLLVNGRDGDGDDVHNIYVNSTKTSPDANQESFYSNYDFPPPSVAYPKDKSFSESRDTSEKQFCSQENIYTNTIFPPFTSKETELKLTVNDQGFDRFETSSIGRQNSAPLSSAAQPSQGNMLYVNLHVSRSLSDVLSLSDISESYEASVSQGSSIYCNPPATRTDLVGLQARALLPLSNDNLAMKGSNSSSNRIVLSVTQETGCTSGQQTSMHTAHDDGDEHKRLRSDTSRKEIPIDEMYVNLEDLKLTAASKGPIQSPRPNETVNRSTSVNCNRDNKHGNDSEKGPHLPPPPLSPPATDADDVESKDDAKNVIYHYPRPTRKD